MRESGRAGSITALALACALTGLGCKDRDLAFHGGGERLVCSRGIDDRIARVPWAQIEAAMGAASATRGVLAFHAHAPGITVSREALTTLFALADAHGLAPLTFRELAAGGPPRAGFVLAFDDDSPAAWESIAGLLADHRVHATFFISHWAGLSADDRARVHRLAAAGHDIEPHGELHVHAPAYAATFGIAAYVRDELEPSIDQLAAAGFPPATAFAYPYGEHTAELDDAVLRHVAIIRAGAAHCRIPHRGVTMAP